MKEYIHVIELDYSHKQQFDEFIIEQTSARKLDSSWNDISFISENRRIFAAVDNDGKFIQVLASNKTPVTGVGWMYLDTQLSRKIGIKLGKQVTFNLLDFVIKTHEKIGVWGWWWVHAGRLKKHITWPSGVLHPKGFGAHYSVAFAKYNIMDIAVVPAGTVTNIPLYDFILNGPLEKDAVLRFAVPFRQHGFDINNLKDNNIRYI